VGEGPIFGKAQSWLVGWLMELVGWLVDGVGWLVG